MSTKPTNKRNPFLNLVICAAAAVTLAVGIYATVVAICGYFLGAVQLPEDHTISLGDLFFLVPLCLMLVISGAWNIKNLGGNND